MPLFSLFRKKSPLSNLEVSFHTENIDYGTHGYITASCKQRGILKPSLVRFVFVGLPTPPQLNEETIKYLFDQARNKGFDVKSLASYGLTVRTQQPRNLGNVLSEERKMAENGNHRRFEQYKKLSADAVVQDKDMILA